MKNISYKKGWILGTNPAHVEPPLIPLIKEIFTGKSDEDFLKLKVCIYPLSSMSNLYEFKMSLFEHGHPEEFLLFMQNFNMTLTSTGTLNMDSEINNLCTLVRGEVLHQFDLLYADVENTETLNVDYYIRGLSFYFLPVNSLKTISQCDVE